MKNYVKQKHFVFATIRLAQKYESPSFQYTWDIASEPTYFRF
jgi:hypothetical protein